MTVKFRLLGAGIVASVMLSACGSSTSSSLNTLVGSLGASANLQVTLTAQASGGSSAKVQSILKDITIGMNFSNPSGGALSDSSGKANTEITASYKGNIILDLRGVGTNAYLKVDVSSLTSVPGFKIPTSELTAFQLLFGGRWFEIPSTLVSSLAPATRATTASAAKERATITRVIDAITKVIDSGKVNDLGHGKFSETGTLLSIAKAVSSSVKGLGSTGTRKAATVQGTYKLTISTSGSTATGASINVTGPKDAGGKHSATVTALFAHDNVVVSAPSGATVLTPGMIASLFTTGFGK
jgi:hypothetical protein